MKRIKATKEVYYASKTRNVGDEFDAEDADARILVGVEKATYVEEPPAPKPQPPLRTAAIKAEEPEAPAAQAMTTESAAELTGGKRQRYMRRDLRAKE